MKNKTEKVILVGGFHEIIELCKLCNKQIVGIVDNNLTKQYFGHSILGADNDAKDLFDKYSGIPIIITPDLPDTRKQLAKYYSDIGFKFCNLLHPLSTISRFAKFGQGVVLQTGVNCSANVSIGDFVKVNSYANIMHDCVIGNYTTVAPNAVILGRVFISDSSYIGANATILPNIKIGRNAIVGAGAVVTKDVKDGATVIGNPAREMN